MKQFSLIYQDMTSCLGEKAGLESTGAALLQKSGMHRTQNGSQWVAVAFLKGKQGHPAVVPHSCSRKKCHSCHHSDRMGMISESKFLLSLESGSSTEHFSSGWERGWEGLLSGEPAGSAAGRASSRAVASLCCSSWFYSSKKFPSEGNLWLHFFFSAQVLACVAQIQTYPHFMRKFGSHFPSICLK